MRCVNSIMVCDLALVLRTLPLQRGHLLPHPAPEPVALTYAPQSTTATLQPRVAHAKRATGLARDRRLDTGLAGVCIIKLKDIRDLASHIVSPSHRIA